MNYSKALRVVRTARGLAQKDLAHRLDVEPAYLSMLERGSRQPSRAFLERFAHTTGLSAPLLALLASGEAGLARLSEEELRAFGAEFLKFTLTNYGDAHGHDDRDP